MVGNSFEQEECTCEFLQKVFDDPEEYSKLLVAVEELDLDAYGALLYEAKHQLRTTTIKNIRGELVAPYAEVRPEKGWRRPDSGTMPWELNKEQVQNSLLNGTKALAYWYTRANTDTRKSEQEFNLLTGESTRRRGDVEKNSLMDQVVHVRVIRLIRPLPKEGQVLSLLALLLQKHKY
jgi:hypothetical protein